MRLRRGGPEDPELWALTPDPEDRSTWKLPLADDAGQPSARRVAAAIGALSPDAHPTIPVKFARDARRKILAAFRRLHGPDVAPPAAITKADLFAPSIFDDDGEPWGVMVAVVPDPVAARAMVYPLSGPGEYPVTVPVEELHVTLVYLGPLEWYSSDDLDALVAVLRQFVAGAFEPADYEGQTRSPRWPMHGGVSGFGVFQPRDPDDPEATWPAVALVDVDDLQHFRHELCETLNRAGFYASSNFDYLPHITLAYARTATEAQSLPIPAPVPFVCSDLVVSWGGQTTRIPFHGEAFAKQPGAGMAFPAAAPDLRPVAKAADDRRYTLAPLYVPGRKDTHGEWATADDLEAAVWSYLDKDAVRSHGLEINLQHYPGLRAGRCVGIISWPFPVDVELVTGPGVTESVTIPAGTIWQGVVWEPWAWDLVLSGKINALSLEGFAFRANPT